MKLYHATKLENKDNILEVGITALLSEKESCDERLNQPAVYGFDNPEDAIDFIVYDNNCSEYVVFEFYAEDAINDPEYDGESFAVFGDVGKVTIYCES